MIALVSALGATHASNSAGDCPEKEEQIKQLWTDASIHGEHRYSRYRFTKAFRYVR